MSKLYNPTKQNKILYPLIAFDGTVINCLPKVYPARRRITYCLSVRVLSDKLRQNSCAWAVNLYMISRYGLVVSFGIYFFPGVPPGIWGASSNLRCLCLMIACVSWLCLCLMIVSMSHCSFLSGNLMFTTVLLSGNHYSLCQTSDRESCSLRTVLINH